MNHEHQSDVLIVGSGPAGSTLAILLARLGWSVTMVERAFHPRPKPCGECVNPGAVRVLDRLGLLEPVLDLHPAHLEGWCLRTGEGHQVDARFRPGDGWGLGLPRADLDAALARVAVRHGARLHEGVAVRSIELPGESGETPGLGDNPGWAAAVTREPDGSEARRSAPLIVGADGLRSVAARAINRTDPTPWPNLIPRLRKVSITCRLSGSGPSRRLGFLLMSELGTVGLAPVHTDLPLWNGTVVVDPARWGRSLAGRPREFFQEAITTAQLGWERGPTVLEGPWCSGPFDVPRRRATWDGVLLVGDAAGYYDPLTGQGIYRALRSAELAAPVIDTALRRAGDHAVPGAPCPPIAQENLVSYEAALRRAFRMGRGIQRVIESVVSRERTRSLVFGGLERAPAVGDALVRLTGDVAGPILS